MTKIVLDTHVLLWILLEPEEIKDSLKKQINVAQKKHELIISDISLWEIAMLNMKGRINVYEPLEDFLKDIVALKKIYIESITAEIAANSVTLGDKFHGDPADRIIVATAKVNKATLFTRDNKILDWAKSGKIKCCRV